MSCWSLYLLMPSLTWDSAVHGLMNCCDFEHLLVGRWAWEMSIGIGLCLSTWTLFMAFFHHNGSLANSK